MVFGKGKRFSPFTQAMGNRKAAFPTPLRAKHADTWLRTGDLATLYSNSWLDQLRKRRLPTESLIKWGDEARYPQPVVGCGRTGFQRCGSGPLCLEDST